MEQNKKPRNGPTNVWPTNLLQRRKEYLVEKTVSSANGVGKKWTAICRRKNLDHFLTLYTKNKLKIDERPKCKTGSHQNPRWMKDLNVRQEATKILEEKIGSSLFNLSCSNFLFIISPEARETKAKLNYWYLMKIKTFWMVKDRKTKR